MKEILDVKLVVFIHNIFRVMSQDPDTVMKLSDTLRNAYMEVTNNYRKKSEELSKTNPDVAKIYLELAKSYDDMSTASWLFQGLALNAVDDNKRLNELIESLSKSTGDNAQTIEALKKYQQEQASSVEQIAKYKSDLEFMNRFLKDLAENTTTR